MRWCAVDLLPPNWTVWARVFLGWEEQKMMKASKFSEARMHSFSSKGQRV